MVTARTTVDERAMRGQELERRIRRGMGAADIRGMAALARRAGVQRDTLYAWFRGDQEPRPDTLARVADVLGLQLADLWAYAPEQPADPLLAALSGQTAALEQMCARLAELIEAQDQSFREFAKAILDLTAAREDASTLGGGSAPGAAPVASSRRDRS